MEEILNEAEARLEANKAEQNRISEELTFLPKGHINILYRKDKGYYYLTHREGKKICNDYLGPVGKTDLSGMMEKLAERERCRKELKYLKEQEKLLKKELKKAGKDVTEEQA
ncbi:MAG: hypothetical protein IKX97_07770 [Erysipelotrichaceae bacterium]|nr:hypothetical protein [Erysipelotrichaceae bacterium]